MRTLKPVLLGALLAATAVACEENPLNTKVPEEPAPPSRGIQAFLSLDRQDAKPGDIVEIAVKIQIGSASDIKLGSYTGSLTFDPQALRYVDEVKVNDGLRVANPNGAEQGTVRFAGAAAKGFTDLALYRARFEVKKAGFEDGLSFAMQELSGALTLSHLEPQLRIEPTIFFSRSGN